MRRRGSSAMIILVGLAVASASIDGVRIFSALAPDSCAALADALASASQTQNGTLWLPADASPRTSMERAAAAVFALHTAGRTFVASRSGAEYWVQSHVEAGDGGLSSGIPFGAATGSNLSGEGPSLSNGVKIRVR